MEMLQSTRALSSLDSNPPVCLDEALWVDHAQDADGCFKPHVIVLSRQPGAHTKECTMLAPAVPGLAPVQQLGWSVLAQRVCRITSSCSVRRAGENLKPVCQCSQLAPLLGTQPITNSCRRRGPGCSMDCVKPCINLSAGLREQAQVIQRCVWVHWWRHGLSQLRNDNALTNVAVQNDLSRTCCVWVLWWQRGQSHRGRPCGTCGRAHCSKGCSPLG